MESETFKLMIASFFAFKIIFLCKYTITHIISHEYYVAPKFVWLAKLCTQEMKLYHVYHAEAADAESKLKHSEEQRAKVAAQANPASRKLKTLEQQVEKVRRIIRISVLCNWYITMHSWFTCYAGVTLYLRHIM